MSGIADVRAVLARIATALALPLLAQSFGGCTSGPAAAAPDDDVGLAVPGADSSSCPRCHGTAVLPIWYGRLTEKGQRGIAAGRAVAGGCIVTPSSPDWCCSSCGCRWYDADDPRRRAWIENEERLIEEAQERQFADTRPVAR